MTTKIGACVFVDPSEIRHDRTPGGGGCLTFGPYPTVERLDLHFNATDAIDAVMAELAALRAEMTGEADDTYRLTLKGYAALGAGEGIAEQDEARCAQHGEPECDATDRGYICTARAGHGAPEHIAYSLPDRVHHRWPVTAAAQDEAPALPLPWTADPQAGTWRAQLPDGRTAVIRRATETDGTTLFIPYVHDSALEFVTGPAFAGLLDAGQWCQAQAAAPAAVTA